MTDLLSRTYGIVVADDEPFIRHALIELFSDHPSLYVIGEASSGREAAHLAKELNANIAVVDVGMPTGGVEAIRLIHGEVPGLPVVVFTANRGRLIDRQLREAGAAEVVVKGSATDIVAVALEAVGAQI